MSDYIKREDAIERLSYHTDFYQNDREFGTEEMLYKDSALNEISELPSADVRENVTGEWIEKKPMNFGKCVNGLGSIFKCSVCGEEILCCTTNYCPNCGADMRGGE